jgi:glycosyltransferase involved in cell wall biosynthesis
VTGPSTTTGARTRVAVLTADVVAEQMAGPAIRAWHLAEELAAEHDVRFASTTRCELTHPAFEATRADGAAVAALVDWCDVVVFQGWVMRDHPVIAESDKVVVVDAYDPMHLEQLEQARDLGARRWAGAVVGATVVLDQQLTRADYVLCASEEQRMLWLGQLAALGRVNPEIYAADRSYRSFIDVVPFGLPDRFPPPTGPAIRGVVDGIGPDEVVLLWNGGVYNWFDPATLIEAVAALVGELPQLRLVFMGMQHPNPDVPAMRAASDAVELADALGLTGRHVTFNTDWVPYDRRHDFLAEADLVVSTHLPGLETDFAFRTRVLDAMWAGTPMVLTEGGPLSNLVARERMGEVVPPGDVPALAAAIRRLVTDPARAGATRARVAEVAAGFRWSVVARPLVEFCRHPRRAADAAVVGLVADRRYDLGVGFDMRHPWLRRVVRAAYLADQQGVGGLAGRVARRLGSRRRGVTAPPSGGSGTPEPGDRTSPRG